jgi:hypothetical protein
MYERELSSGNTSSGSVEMGTIFLPKLERLFSTWVGFDPLESPNSCEAATWESCMSWLADVSP